MTLYAAPDGWWLVPAEPTDEGTASAGEVVAATPNEDDVARQIALAMDADPDVLAYHNGGRLPGYMTDAARAIVAKFVPRSELAAKNAEIERLQARVKELEAVVALVDDCDALTPLTREATRLESMDDRNARLERITVVLAEVRRARAAVVATTGQYLWDEDLELAE